jgi:hypothetical protein
VGLNGVRSTLSGTSPVAAHVRSVEALYKDTYGDAAPSTVETRIKNNATFVSFGKLLYKDAL